MKAIPALTTGISLLFAPFALADTVVELVSQGAETQFLTNGSKARINTRNQSEYMLVDFSDNSIYAVMPEKKQVIRVSDSIPAISASAPPDINVKLTPAGPGPEIAGFPTNRFAFSANGEDCGTVYGSKTALQGTSIDKLLRAMSTMAEKHTRSLGAFAAAMPPCQLARLEFSKHLDITGAPLRIQDASGNIDSSVKRISTEARVDAAAYVMPAGYENVSAADKITEVRHQGDAMRNMQQRDPEMQQMMKQMMESGRMPPEAMEQMQRYQRMMETR